MGVCTLCKNNEKSIKELELPVDEHFTSSSQINFRVIEVLHNVAKVSKGCKVKLSTNKGRVNVRKEKPHTSEYQRSDLSNNDSNQKEDHNVLMKTTTMKPICHGTLSNKKYNNYKEDIKECVEDEKRLDMSEEKKEETFEEKDIMTGRQEAKIEDCDDGLNGKENNSNGTKSFKTLNESVFNIVKINPKELLEVNKMSEVVFDLKNLRLERNKIQVEKYKKLSVIGKGAFGEVHKIMHVDTKKIYAMKVVNKFKCLDPSNILNEIEVLKTLVLLPLIFIGSS